jgi:S1-C subfamily serine protease
MMKWWRSNTEAYREPPDRRPVRRLEMSTQTEPALDVDQPGATLPTRYNPISVAAGLLIAFAMILAGVGVGWLAWGGDGADQQTTATTIATTAGSTPTLPKRDEPVAAVASALLPAVVQLESSSGVGSGVVYDQAGLILTAAHVVGNDPEVSVRFASGDRVTGEVVGTDPSSDVAVVRVDEGDLFVAPLAVDTPIEVGQTAIALGSPYGLEQTVTAGIISATDRSVVGSDGLVRRAIQTDAPINPGNSGGPLADLQGRVIGINDAIFTQSGGNEGVGFAIPITVAKHIADRLVAGEPIETAFLGISGTDPESGDTGALITAVVPGSPADTAGLHVGDLIITVDGTRVEGMVDLAAAVRSRQPGDEATIGLVRGADQLEFTVTLGSNT